MTYFWIVLAIFAAYGIFHGFLDVIDLFAENNDDPFEPSEDFIPKSLKKII